jgi:hypothetical protein
MIGHHRAAGLVCGCWPHQRALASQHRAAGLADSRLPAQAAAAAAACCSSERGGSPAFPRRAHQLSRVVRAGSQHGAGHEVCCAGEQAGLCLCVFGRVPSSGGLWAAPSAPVKRSAMTHHRHQPRRLSAGSRARFQEPRPADPAGALGGPWGLGRTLLGPWATCIAQITPFRVEGGRRVQGWGGKEGSGLSMQGQQCLRAPRPSAAHSFTSTHTHLFPALRSGFHPDCRVENGR